MIVLPIQKTKEYKMTGIDMIKIDIANCYGLDKLTFDERIELVNSNKDNLWELVDTAKEPLLFRKALLAWEDTQLGVPTGHNMFMDATASGLQIMAALSNCKSTGLLTNLVYNGKRNDVYTAVAEEMAKRLPDSYMFAGLSTSEIRDIVKRPIMTTFYNSKASPKAVFGEDTVEYNTFMKVLEEMMPGGMAVMAIINGYWDSTAYYHQWTLPDGHVAHVKVKEQVDTRIEVPEMEVAKTFAYRFYPNQPSGTSTSLAPNIIHSIDAYVAREVVRRCDFEVAHIHDAFTAHPNNMPKVLEVYREVLAEIAEMDLLADILSQVSGEEVVLEKFDFDMASSIRESVYALS